MPVPSRKSPAKRPGKSGGDTYCVLQFDNAAISAVRVRQGEGRPTLLAHSVEQGAWNDEDGTLEAALRKFAERFMQPGDRLCSILPRYEITTRLLELPAESDAEIDGMLHLNAEEHVPYAADELVIRHARLHTLMTRESVVLAVFARSNVVENHLALLQGAGLEPEQILLSTACLLAAVAQAAPGHPERFALAHVASSGLEVLVQDEGKSVFLRGVSLPHAPDSNTDELIAELRASLSTYRRESVDGLGVDHVFISSDVLPAEPLAFDATNELGKDCAAADFLKSLVANPADVPKELPAVLLGGALAAAGKAKVHVNLLPEHVRQARQMSGVRTQLARIAVVVAVALVLSVGLYAQRVWQYNRYITQLEREARALAPLAEGVVEKQAQLNIIKRQVAREGNVLDLLGATVASLPEQDANITKFSYDRAVGMEVFGRAATVDEIANFVSGLRRMAVGPLEMLKTAHRIYDQQEYEREQQVMLYRIGVPLVEPEGEEASSESAP